MNQERKNAFCKLFRKQNSIFMFLFLITGCFVFWKCRYGFGHIDESFYLTVPYRLLQGDALFQEEWHLSQMAGVLTMPFVAAYLSLKGSAEGLLLAMRYVCTAIQCAMSVFLYTRLKKINWLGAVIAAICFLLYTPFGVMALSYNSMGILFLTVSQVIMLTAKKGKKIQYGIAGLSFAAGVLCCPFLLLMYIGYLAVVAVRLLALKTKGQYHEDSVWSVRSALCFTCGAAAAAVLFAIFVLSRSSIDEIIRAFPPMLNDPEHLPGPRFYKLKVFFTSIFYKTACARYGYGILAILWLICLLDRKRRGHRGMYSILVSGTIVFMMIDHFAQDPFINVLMWSINLFAPFIVVLSENRMVPKLFCTIWLPGIGYSYCLNMASNQGFLAISSGSTVAMVGTLVMLGIFFDELRNADKPLPFRKLAAGMLGVVVCIQIIMQFYSRYESVFWDKEMENMTLKISDGLEKGIITSEDLYYNYYAQLNDLKQVDKYQGEKILYLSENTWYYLESEKEMATYSAWLSGVNEHTLDRLEIYYDINPHKLPDVVFADSGHLEMAEEFGRRFSYHMEETGPGYLLLLR